MQGGCWLALCCSMICWRFTCDFLSLARFGDTGKGSLLIVGELMIAERGESATARRGEIGEVLPSGLCTSSIISLMLTKE